MKKYIEQNNIKVYVNFLQLHDLQPGASVVMVGPYGSGKTTACYAILDQVQLKDLAYTLVVSSHETVLLGYREKFPNVNTLMCEGDIDVDMVTTFLNEPRGVIIVDSLDLRRWNIASKIEKLLMSKPKKTIVVTCQEVTTLPSKVLDHFGYYMLFRTESISDLTLLHKYFFSRKHRWIFPTSNYMITCIDRIAVGNDIMVVDTFNNHPIHWTNARAVPTFNTIVNQMIRKSHMLEEVQKNDQVIPGQVLIVEEKPKIDINTVYVDSLSTVDIPEEETNGGLCVIL